MLQAMSRSLDVATRSGFLLLADDPQRELVVGTVVIAPAGMKRPATPEQFKELDAPGVAKAVMNFRIDDAGDGACLLSTETRVHATDAFGIGGKFATVIFVAEGDVAKAAKALGA